MIPASKQDRIKAITRESWEQLKRYIDAHVYEKPVGEDTNNIGNLCPEAAKLSGDGTYEFSAGSKCRDGGGIIVSIRIAPDDNSLACLFHQS
jgi:hypothetical protein